MIHRPIRYYYYRMMRQRGTPHQLASGLAFGVFVGLTVPYGLQILTIVLAALVFRQFNRIAALLGCMVSNPLTMPFLYVAYYRFGTWLTGLWVRGDVADTETLWTMLQNYSLLQNPLLYLKTLLEMGSNTLLAMGSAALLIATVAALLTYFVAKPTIDRYQRRREKRLQAAFKVFVERAKSLAQRGGGKAEKNPEDRAEPATKEE